MPSFAHSSRSRTSTARPASRAHAAATSASARRRQLPGGLVDEIARARDGARRDARPRATAARASASSVPGGTRRVTVSSDGGVARSLGEVAVETIGAKRRRLRPSTLELRARRPRRRATMAAERAPAAFAMRAARPPSGRRSRASPSGVAADPSRVRRAAGGARGCGASRIVRACRWNARRRRRPRRARHRGRSTAAT